MADLLPDEEFPIKDQLPLRRIRHKDGGRGEHYPFDAWADGRDRLAYRGKDYKHTTPRGFCGTLQRWAKQWGVTCTAIPMDDGKVFFNLGPLSEEAKARRDYNYGPLLYNLEEERGY